MHDSTIAGRMFVSALISASLPEPGVDHVFNKYMTTAPAAYGPLALDLATSGIHETGVLVGPEYDSFEYGRRICAAVIAIRDGLNSVDEVLRSLPARIDRAWPDLARECREKAVATAKAEREYPWAPKQREIDTAATSWVPPTTADAVHHNMLAGLKMIGATVAAKPDVELSEIKDTFLKDWVKTCFKLYAAADGRKFLWLRESWYSLESEKSS